MYQTLNYYWIQLYNLAFIWVWICTGQFIDCIFCLNIVAHIWKGNYQNEMDQRLLKYQKGQLTKHYNWPICSYAVTKTTFNVIMFSGDDSSQIDLFNDITLASCLIQKNIYLELRHKTTHTIIKEEELLIKSTFYRGAKVNLFMHRTPLKQSHGCVETLRNTAVDIIH